MCGCEYGCESQLVTRMKSSKNPFSHAQNFRPDLTPYDKLSPRQIVEDIFCPAWQGSDVFCP